VVVVSTARVVEELDSTGVEEVEVPVRVVVARKELEVEYAPDELESENIADVDDDTIIGVVELDNVPLRVVDEAAEDEPSLVVIASVELALGRVEELDASLRRDVETPDVEIAATVVEEEELAGVSTDDVGKLELAKAVDTEPEVVPIVEWDAIVCCAVAGMMVLVAAAVTVLDAAAVSVLDAATCEVETGTKKRVEADADPAATDKLGVRVIVRDTGVVEAAADEVVDVIVLVEMAIVSCGSADVVLGLHDDPSPKNPALQTHTTLSVSLPSAHVEIGDALAPHVLHAVHVTPFP